ncbi:MAG: isoaspartyl peptidase/L-asparaginase [Chthoniobacterales bacterium]|nr:isoaspartyl peptidase/L-asparaginase [Chthoniobacterales bacterium]
MPKSSKPFRLVLHGGAGTIDRGAMTPEREKQYRAALEQALRAGYDVLKKGGAGLDAVEAAVRVLEDDPHFNAGRGAVFTAAGTHELDAAIMEGRTRKAGAIAAVKHIRNPITVARMVMEKSPHVLLTGDGAEDFAKQLGAEIVDQKYFDTPERWDVLQRIKKAEKAGGVGGKKFIVSEADRHGTVGAVALDQNGDLAAATSTGGMTNKRVGRIGDSPVIGAGTYANNVTCAISGTGDGEFFIRSVVAHDISALMEYRGLSLADASNAVLEKVAKLGGTEGLVAVDRAGNFALPFNTNGMYRGTVGVDGKTTVEIYK